MTTAMTLERVFKMGSIVLPDPDPGCADPIEALKLLQPNYPHLANARLCEPVVDGDKLCYTIEKPNPEKKG